MLKQDFNTHDGAAGKNAARTPKQSAPRKTPSRPKKAPKPDDITKAIESLAENRPRSFANTPMNSKNAALFSGLAQAERGRKRYPAAGDAGAAPLWPPPPTRSMGRNTASRNPSAASIPTGDRADIPASPA